MRLVLLVLVALAGVMGGLYVAAGRAAGPAIEIVAPDGLVGRAGTLDVTVTAPGGDITALEAGIEQSGQRYPLFSLDDPSAGAIRQETADRVRVTRDFDRTSHPSLEAGPAVIRVSATRPVLFGLRNVTSDAAMDVEVRLDPPRLQVVSTFHHINHGGSELVVYRVTPPDAESGVRVGERFYRGYAASGAGIDRDDDLRVAFFALLHDQDLQTPIDLYARDAAGNEATATFAYETFPKPFRRSTISLSDSFLRRVVPAIVSQSPDLADETIEPDHPIDDLLQLYLFINGTLRERNRETVAAQAEATSPDMLWSGTFVQPPGSQVESSFADYRTYVYDGDDVDQQVHLGFDLASVANAPVIAANEGTVLYADYLGIFGNCVIIDHGMGLQSLYAHLSSFEVAPGDSVTDGQVVGRSGQTGLAGGDHLHFAMLLQGHPVTPVEWWDPHWLEDRVLRKLREAGAPLAAVM